MPIRSFVRRQGRMTPGQQRALNTLWPTYGISPNALSQPQPLFAAAAQPVVMDIGFGTGTALMAMIQQQPQVNFIGVEVHQPGIGRLLLQLGREPADNIKIVQADAVVLLEHHCPDNALSGVQLFFPDPWPKKKHHKRRLVQPQFTELLQRKIAPNGFFHFASDWAPYAEAVAALLESDPNWHNISDQPQGQQRIAHRPTSRFQQRGLALGHGITDLVWINRTPPHA